VPEPTHKTILLTDIEGSGTRLDSETPVLRREMYAVLRETLTAAGVEPTEYRTEDRGDGAFVLIDPAVPKPQLIRALLTTMPMRLYDYNAKAAEGTRVRLRVVVHAGEVALDEEGALGADLVAAFRLLNAEALKSALRRTEEPTVLCVSDALHRDVVSHRHYGIRHEHFHPFEIDADGGTRKGWYFDPLRRRDTEPHQRAGHPRPEARGAEAPPEALNAGSHGTRGGEGDPPPALAHTFRVERGNFFLGPDTRIRGDVVANNKIVRPSKDEDEDAR
jgi:hypothetical protein